MLIVAREPAEKLPCLEGARHACRCQRNDPTGADSRISEQTQIYARDPGARVRDIATAAGITERTAQAIVADLEGAGYITRTRTGRRVQYTVNRDSLFRHPAQEGHRVGPFLALLATVREATAAGPDD